MAAQGEHVTTKNKVNVKTNQGRPRKTIKNQILEMDHVKSQSIGRVYSYETMSECE